MHFLIPLIRYTRTYMFPHQGDVADSWLLVPLEESNIKMNFFLFGRQNTFTE